MNTLAPFTRNVTRAPTMTDRETRDPFLALHRDINQLFDEALRGFAVPGAERGLQTGLWPSIEVSDHGNEIRVTAEVAGMTHDDIDLSLEGDALVLRGEKKAEHNDDARRVSERFYGRFERRIPLGFEVGQEQVDASFRNGVLTVTVPKPADAPGNAKRIEISAEG